MESQWCVTPHKVSQPGYNPLVWVAFQDDKSDDARSDMYLTESYLKLLLHISNDDIISYCESCVYYALSIQYLWCIITSARSAPVNRS